MSVEITGEEKLQCGCWIWHEGPTKAYPAAGRGPTWVLQRRRPKPQHHFSHVGVQHFCIDRDDALEFHEKQIRDDPDWCKAPKKKR